MKNAQKLEKLIASFKGTFEYRDLSLLLTQLNNASTVEEKTKHNEELVKKLMDMSAPTVEITHVISEALDILVEDEKLYSNESQNDQEPLDESPLIVEGNENNESTDETKTLSEEPTLDNASEIDPVIEEPNQESVSEEIPKVDPVIEEPNQESVTEETPQPNPEEKSVEAQLKEAAVPDVPTEAPQPKRSRRKKNS